ncbi:PQQ-like beta-propeller repeat protein [Campylobacter sp. RM16187]|uniref:PQQ-like beta-propeller repeat protein n=1 Tax=Campylobacter sp. RM16187 TaxID=1660063 RepID=UPI0021B5A6D7|nr:PQQ-like beta-propeller repeat protein [Campylobacter sp. RM16187]QKG28850.1 putative beta-barrel assembly machinery complex lipoprotein BamB [Campylobacter sp. RM16187]
MKKIYTIISILSALFLLGGCGTKRQYFEPENVDLRVNFDYTLPSHILTTSVNGAILKNGMVVTKDGVLSNDISFTKDTILLNAYEDKIITSSLDGNLIVTGKTKEVLFQRSFNEAIVSAAIDGDKLALVTASNIIYLIDTIKNINLLEFESSAIYTQDSRAAAPYFMSSLVIFPTLDGKIMIVDKNQGKILRDVVVSSDEFFNNIIFLDVINDTMIAATGKRIVVINPERTLYYNGEIKNIVSHKDRLYILKKDGEILLTDLNLQKLNSINFKFAIFSNAITLDDHLYIIEKKGYLIKADLDLKKHQIFRLNDEIDDKSFISFKEFYYDNKYLKLK